MKQKKWNGVLIVASLLVVCIIVVTIVGLTFSAPAEIIQGEVEMTDYRISSKVPARVAEMRVAEGDHVKRGDTLVVMGAPDIAAKLSQAEAAQAAARATDESVQNGSRQEQVQAAYELWQKALARADVAEKTYRRVSNLCEQGVVPEQKRDEAKAQYDAMRATAQAAHAQYELARKGEREERRAASRAQVERANGAVSEVRSYVDETVLLAMADGVVTEIFPEVGELVGTGAPIMNIASTDDAWFTFNVREDLLTTLPVGTDTTVYLPALDRTVPVRITRMKEVGSFAVWKATKALDRYDLKTFEVRATPTDRTHLGEVRSGMSAIIK